MRGFTGWRHGLALAIALVLATGCSAGSSIAPPGSSSAAGPTVGSAPPPSGAPSTARATAAAASIAAQVPADHACPALATPMTAWPTVEWPLPTSGAGGASTSAAFQADSKRMADELVAAVGNPDTGSKSEAWSAFEAALTKGDAAAVRAAAEQILAHLRASCAAIAPHLGEGGAPWAADVRGLLDGTALAVARMRDAGAKGDPAGIRAGQDLFQAVMLDHFYQSFSDGTPRRWETTLRTKPLKATASHVRWHVGEVSAAFDGTPETAWEAGDVPAPQWIEVDLGAATTVSGVRLLAWQPTPGATDHRVTIRTVDGAEAELAKFTGVTRDSQSLEYRAPTAVSNVRAVRVTTLSSPSMIGWREVEVLTPEGSLTGPCPAATAPITGVAKAVADPPTQTSDPRRAVDGDLATSWEPAPPGTTKYAGSIRIWYAEPFRASTVRVRSGQGGEPFPYSFALFEPVSGQTVTTGFMPAQPAADGWTSASVTGSCHVADSVGIYIQANDTPGPIVEIEVLGTPAK
ncbi:MAG TPA: discoidin domain-containing protein [Candidatus Limnocylindrales bacterium]